MYTLPETLPTLDEVADPLKDFYVKDGDQYKLSSPKAIEASMRNAKKEAQERGEALKEKDKALNQWESLGAPLEEVKSVLEKRAEFEAFQKPEEIVRIKSDLEASHKGKLEMANQETQKYKSYAEKQAREAFLNAALDKHGVNDAGRNFLKDRLAAQINFGWENDNVVPKILDKDGKLAVDENYDPMTVDTLLEQHKKDAPFFFKSQFGGIGGSGASGDGPAPDANSTDPTRWSFTEVQAYKKQHGPDAYQKLVANWKPKTPAKKV